jgi:hypothetical protein
MKPAEIPRVERAAVQLLEEAASTLPAVLSAWEVRPVAPEGRLPVQPDPEVRRVALEGRPAAPRVAAALLGRVALAGRGRAQADLEQRLLP